MARSAGLAARTVHAFALASAFLCRCRVTERVPVERMTVPETVRQMRASPRVVPVAKHAVCPPMQQQAATDRAAISHARATIRNAMQAALPRRHVAQQLIATPEITKSAIQMRTHAAAKAPTRCATANASHQTRAAQRATVRVGRPATPRPTHANVIPVQSFAAQTASRRRPVALAMISGVRVRTRAAPRGSATIPVRASNVLRSRIAQGAASIATLNEVSVSTAGPQQTVKAAGLGARTIRAWAAATHVWTLARNAISGRESGRRVRARMIARRRSTSITARLNRRGALAQRSKRWAPAQSPALATRTAQSRARVSPHQSAT